MERETANIYLKEGNKLKRLGKLKEAIASYRQAIKINP
ncbi:MAG: tetratricopeptide repeat protein [Okeania sp. SIO2G4]|nr:MULTISPECIES: tetratricopeptide repeat protein [unclassified Okeania]NEP08502.1 tetratricopeptide repeat protein [Okeania sp. SIO4D6]NEP39919.1 tetratricopeptide repeat protein [Okeania sp. SIO2H7]NEP73009.1 tetratricopeptide repeat protein [Okeania sp. SIO2G5]NEP93773.1 tetratricopeptide repeat protein [Okeania sp. SIO2F5]NEQ91648.1 tetratricopeptide repeat protein [Okeania sp. SIO2G4]